MRNTQLGNGRIAIFEDSGVYPENAENQSNCWRNRLPGFASLIPLNTPKNKTMSPFCRQVSEPVV
jgi:hypothetical protein